MRPRPAGPEVQVGFEPVSWSRTAGPSCPLVASAQWIGSMGSRIEGDVVTFRARDGRDAALLGIVVSGRARAPYNLRELLLETDDRIVVPPDVASERASLAAATPPESRWSPCLVVMYPGYLCRVVGGDAEDPAVVRSLVDDVIAWAAAEGLRAIAFLFVAEPDVTLTAAVRERTASPGFLIDHHARLDLSSVDGWEDYLQQLPPKRRREVRREDRRLRERGVSTDVVSAAEHLDEAVALRCGLVERYGRPPDPERERATLSMLLDAFGDDVQVFVASQDGRTVGFSLQVAWCGWWHAIWTGTLLDRADPAHALIYFDTVFYAPIKAAPHHNITGIDFGVGASLAKALRGCTLEPARGFALSFDPGLDDTIRRATALLVDAERGLDPSRSAAG